jgi:hypothetical protein
MSWLRRFGSFWYDFIVGDDWRLALVGAARPRHRQPDHFGEPCEARPQLTLRP